MAKKSGEQGFASAATSEELGLALQKRLASGELTSGETRAVELIAQLRGWIGGKTPKPATEPPAPVNPLLVEEPPSW